MDGRLGTWHFYNHQTAIGTVLGWLSQGVCCSRDIIFSRAIVQLVVVLGRLFQKRIRRGRAVGRLVVEISGLFRGHQQVL